MGDILVFAQQPDARADVAAWQDRATQFFGETISATPKRYAYEYPKEDSIEVTVGTEKRMMTARPATEMDYAAADVADEKRGYTGLATLAHRCKTVWLIENDDRTSLLLAAVIASVLLGPILIGEELLGVRTAREKVLK